MSAPAAKRRSPRPKGQPLGDHIRDLSEFDTIGGCWLWTGARSSSGYGTVTVNRRSLLVHRVSYEAQYGPIAEGLSVCHRCDTPLCVNPAHLFVGTHADNSNDKVRKGRQVRFVGKRKGENNPNAALTAADVVDIRCSRLSVADLAKKHGVSIYTIYGVRAHRNWKDVVHAGK